MFQEFDLTGKAALITGGTRGIGLAIARGFLQCGARVAICSRKQENVDDAVSQLAEYADDVTGVVAHVGQGDAIETLAATVAERLGTIDILVNNAGTNPYHGPIIKSTSSAWDKTMDVNLKGPYLLSKACAKQMIASGGGAIINIASVAGLVAAENQGIYSVSKAGLIMLTKVMAREFGQHGIRVNCICPGLIKTRLSQAMWSNPARETAIAKLKAVGRIGTAEEVAGAAIYFASPASSFTTGAVLQVDGGMVI